MGTGLKFLFEEEVAMNQGTILGTQKGRWITLAVLVAVFAALLMVSVVRAQEDSATIDVRRERRGPGGDLHGHGPGGRNAHRLVLGNG